MRSYKTVQTHDSQKLILVYYMEITNVYYNFTKICAHICVFRYFFVILHRVWQKQFLGNQKRRTHHRYAFSPRGFERKQLIRILCEHKCALIFTLVADDLTNRCWVLTKTRTNVLTKKPKTATLIPNR